MLSATAAIRSGGHGPEGLTSSVALLPAGSAQLGMRLFILAEAMLFASFFAAYFYLRAGAQAWPPTAGLARPDVFPMVTLDTLILLSSSLTAHLASDAATGGKREGVVRWLAVTLSLGILFLFIQVWEIAHLGFGPADGIFGSTFYTLVSFHGLHVLVGVLLLAGLLNRAARGLIDKMHHPGLDNVSAYWHFVDIVWLVLFTTVYLI